MLHGALIPLASPWSVRDSFVERSCLFWSGTLTQLILRLGASKSCHRLSDLYRIGANHSIDSKYPSQNLFFGTQHFSSNCYLTRGSYRIFLRRPRPLAKRANLGPFASFISVILRKVLDLGYRAYLNLKGWENGDWQREEDTDFLLRRLLSTLMPVLISHVLSGFIRYLRTLTPASTHFISFSVLDRELKRFQAAFCSSLYVSLCFLNILSFGRARVETG